MMQSSIEQNVTAELNRFRYLQQILRCPQTGEPMELLDAEQIRARLPEEKQQVIPAGMSGAFVSEGKQIAFPIIENIVHLLRDDAILISEESPSNQSNNEDADVKASVKQFYDEYGWKRNNDGVYNDTWINSQAGLTANGVYEMMSHLKLVDRVASGEFLLDAASGAIAHPEYLSYSWQHQFRVCVDMSQTALNEASAKLDERGFYILTDICQLPFCDNAFDGVVSGYTTQHIPNSQQRQAVSELYRTLKPCNHLCIMTNIKLSLSHQIMFQTVRALLKILKLFGIVRFHPLPQAENPKSSSQAPHNLYFHPQTFGWWKHVSQQLSPSYRLECLRLYHKREFEYLFGASIDSARSVRRWETFFPRLLARMSVYVLVDICKPRK